MPTAKAVPCSKLCRQHTEIETPPSDIDSFNGERPLLWVLLLVGLHVISIVQKRRPPARQNKAIVSLHMAD
jgi:hypothetical protein